MESLPDPRDRRTRKSFPRIMCKNDASVYMSAGHFEAERVIRRDLVVRGNHDHAGSGMAMVSGGAVGGAGQETGRGRLVDPRRDADQPGRGGTTITAAGSY